MVQAGGEEGDEAGMIGESTVEEGSVGGREGREGTNLTFVSSISFTFTGPKILRLQGHYVDPAAWDVSGTFRLSSLPPSFLPSLTNSFSLLPSVRQCQPRPPPAWLPSCPLPSRSSLRGGALRAVDAASERSYHRGLGGDGQSVRVPRPPSRLPAIPPSFLIRTLFSPIYFPLNSCVLPSLPPSRRIVGPENNQVLYSVGRTQMRSILALPEEEGEGGGEGEGMEL